MDMTKISAAAVVFVNTVLLAVYGVGDFTLSDAKKGAIVLVVNTSAAFGLAVFAHFRPGTVARPVAVGVSFIAWTSADLGLVTVFGWWGLTEAKSALVQSAIVSLVALVALFVTQSKTVPVKDAEMRERTARSAALRRPPDGHAG
jgi:hypothetical protein